MEDSSEKTDSVLLLENILQAESSPEWVVEQRKVVFDALGEMDNVHFTVPDLTDLDVSEVDLLGRRHRMCIEKIVGVFDVLVTPRLPFLVQDLEEGEDITIRFQANPPWGDHKLCVWSRAFLEGSSHVQGELNFDTVLTIHEAESIQTGLHLVGQGIGLILYTCAVSIHKPNTASWDQESEGWVYDVDCFNSYFSLWDYAGTERGRGA